MQVCVLGTWALLDPNVAVRSGPVSCLGLSRVGDSDALFLAFYFYRLSHNERREDTCPPLIGLQPQHVQAVHRSLSC